MSTWLRRQLTHMLDGLLAMGTPHRQHSLQQNQAVAFRMPCHATRQLGKNEPADKGVGGGGGRMCIAWRFVCL